MPEHDLLTLALVVTSSDAIYSFGAGVLSIVVGRADDVDDLQNSLTTAHA